MALTGARVLRRRRIVTPPSIMFSSESTARCSLNSAASQTFNTLHDYVRISKYCVISHRCHTPL